MNNLILTPVPIDVLLDSFKSIVQDAIKESQQKEQEEKLISPAEACKLFNPPITLPTLSAWEKKGHYKSQRMGGRVWYRRGDILKAGTTLKKFKTNIQ